VLSRLPHTLELKRNYITCFAQTNIMPKYRVWRTSNTIESTGVIPISGHHKGERCRQMDSMLGRQNNT
jgi:hypothetical protein